MLAVASIARSVAFYRDVLGFSAIMQSAEYSIMERDGQTIHFESAPEEVLARVRGHIEIYIEVSGIRPLWEHVRTFKDHYKIKDLFDRDYGITEFHIIDPNGCLVFVGEKSKQPTTPVPQ